MDFSTRQVEVHGTFLTGLAQAAEGLQPLTEELPEACESEAWYPWSGFAGLFDRIRPLEGGARLFERFGRKMMESWYYDGPGQAMLASSLDYLRLQRLSRGYRLVVRGPREVTGFFRLAELDVEGGFARIDSHTLFPKAYERGVLLGGLGQVGDLLYYDVREHPMSGAFHCFFVTRDNLNRLKWHRGSRLSASQWQLLHHGRRARERELFWRSVSTVVARSLGPVSSTDPDPTRTIDACPPHLPELSARESQVISGVLSGRTLHDIAEEIGVAYTSVLTYQQRAFVKLGVSTQKELFRLLLC